MMRLIRRMTRRTSMSLINK